MKTNKLMIAVALAASCAVSVAHAERNRDRDHGRDHQRRDFTTDVTRTTGSGKTFTRHTEQTATDTGFRRESTMTNPEGKTSNRSVEGNYDAETKTYTKDINGTRMNGDSYSAQRTTQKTDDGYNRTRTRTNAEGETATRQVNAEIDKENKTMTKTISNTNFDGETRTKTITRTAQPGNDGAE